MSDIMMWLIAAYVVLLCLSFVIQRKTRKLIAEARRIVAYGLNQHDLSDPLHPRYIAGFKAGHAAGRLRRANDFAAEAQEPNGKNVEQSEIPKFLSQSL